MESKNAERKAQTSLTLRVVLVWGVLLVVMYVALPHDGWGVPTGLMSGVIRACIVVLLVRGLYVSRKMSRERPWRKLIAIAWMTAASVYAMAMVESVVWFLALVLRR